MIGHRFVISGGNRARLEAAREWIAKLPELSEALLLAPSRGAGDDLARRIAQDGSGLWGLHRMTPGQLASILATERLAEEERAPVSSLGVEALAARAAQRCREEKPLEYFKPVADMPGFAGALARTLVELRMEEAEPGKLSASGEPGQDLARLLECYEEELRARKLADYATLLRLAVEANGQWHNSKMPTLFLDLPLGTVAERRLLQAVAQAAPACFASCLRHDQEAVDALRETLAVEPEDLEDGDEPAGELQSVRRWVFQPGDIPAPGEADGSVEFFSAPGEGRESVEIARRIRMAAEQGTPFDRIAILLRNPENYLALIEDALRRARIPAYFTQGTVRPDPAGRAFLALLACAQEGLSASRFAEYLSLGQVPPVEEDGAPPSRAAPWVAPQEGQMSFLSFEPGEIEPTAAQKPLFEESDQEETHKSPVIAGGLRTPFQWEQLLTDAAVIGGGWRRWERRLAGLESELEKRRQAQAAEDDTHAKHLESQLRRLEVLKRFALPLIRQLSEFPEKAAWGEWIGRLRELAARALARPDGVLAALAELEPMGEVGPVDINEVQLVLSERLRTLQIDPPDRRYGKVFVGTVEDAAARSFQQVFVPGLAEGAFPRKAFEDPLLLDDFRELVSDALDRQSDRFERERLLLRTALGAADGKLLISYPRMDAVQGRPRVPSFYALDVLRAAKGQLPDMRKLEQQAALAVKTYLGWPAPKEPEDAIDEAEYDLSVLESYMLQKSPPLGGARYLIEVSRNLARSLRSRWMRWSSRWSEADGLYQPDEPTRAALESQRLSQRPYSPTALQHFAACPYRFLLSAIHGLRPREEMVPLEQIDPLTRGSLFHDTQFVLFQRLKKDDLLPMSEENRREILDRADEVLNEMADRYREELVPAIPRVWKSEIEEIRTDLRGWIRFVIRQEGNWTPSHFEYAFGLRDREFADPESASQEAKILDGYRARGSVDLIEESGFTGALRVVDHKTGRAPSPSPRYVGGGEFLQPTLYGLAVESLMGRDVEAGRLFYCTQRGGYRTVDIDMNDDARARLKKVLATIDREVEQGFLPAAPKEGACKYCDFLPVCGPYEEMRVRRKMQGPLMALEEVRKLP